MAIRSTLLGGTDYTEEGLKPSDQNDTNDAIINNAIDNNGFVLTDVTTLSHTSVTETLKRTYTMNKDIQGIYFTTTMVATGTGTDKGYMTLYKNGTIIAVGDVYPMNMLYDGGDPELRWESSDNRILCESSVDDMAITLFIDVSFDATDTFELKLESDDALTTIESTKRVVQGINNKTTDTTWVSVS